jgi:WD40 repeat protein
MPSLDLDKLKATRKIALAGDHLCVARVPNSDQLWFGSSDHKLYFVDLAAEKPQPVAVEGHKSYVSGAVLTGQHLITGSWDRKLIWWDTEKRQPVRTVNAHQRWIRQIALAPDRSLVASISDDMSAKLWDAVSGKLVRELRGHEPRLPRYDYPNKLFACAFSPDGQLLAVNDELCQVIIWEVSSGKVAARIDAKSFFTGDWDRNNHPYGGLRCLAFSPDGQSLALAGIHNNDVAIISGSGLVQVFDWKAGKLTQDFKNTGGAGQFETLYFHPQGDWLLAGVGGGGKSLLQFFDLKQKRLLKDVPSLMPTFGLAVNENVDAFYTVGRGQIIQWESPA